MEPIDQEKSFEEQFQIFLKKEEYSSQELLEFFLIVNHLENVQENDIKRIAYKVKTLDPKEIQDKNINNIIFLSKKHLIQKGDFSKEEIQELIQQKKELFGIEALEIAYLYGDSDILEEFFGDSTLKSGINIFYDKEKNLFAIEVLAEREPDEEETDIFDIPTDPEDQFRDLSLIFNLLPINEIEFYFYASKNFNEELKFLQFADFFKYSIRELSIENLPFVFSEKGVKEISNYPFLEKLTVNFNEIKDFSPFFSHSKLEVLAFYGEDEEKIEIPHLPLQIKSLEIFGNNCSIQKISPLPLNLQKLSFINFSFNDSFELPNYVVFFELVNCQQIQIKEFSRDLQMLIIKQSDLKKLPSFPNTLKALILENLFYLEEYPPFPPDLFELELKNCKPQEIPPIPTSIGVFILHDTTYPIEPQKKLISIQPALAKDFKKGLFLFDQFHLFEQGIRKKTAEILLEAHKEDLFQDLPLLVKSLGIENLKSLTIFALEKNLSFFFEHAEFLPLYDIFIEKWIQDPNLKEFFEKIFSFKNASHYTEPEEKILNDLPWIQINELKAMLKKVNYDDPKMAGYVEKNNRKDDDGDILSPDEIEKGLDDLLDHIHKKDAYQGVPTNEEARNKFYLRLERRFKHIIDLLKKESDLLVVNKWLTDFGIAGHHCGTRWESDSNQAYYMLQGILPTKTFEEFILLSIANSIVGFIEEASIDLSRHPELGKPYQQHIANYVCQALLPLVKKISNRFPYEKEDPYMDYVGKFFSKGYLLEKFTEYIHLYRLIKRLQEQINSELMGNIDFQDAVIDNLRDFLEKNMTDFDPNASQKLKEFDKELKIKQKEFGEKIITNQLKELPFLIKMLDLELKEENTKEWLQTQKEEDKGMIRRLYGQMKIDLMKEMDEKQKQSEKNAREFEEFYQYVLELFEGKSFTKNETFEKKLFEEFPAENLEKQLEKVKQKRFEIFIEDEILHQGKNSYGEGTREYKLFEEMRENMDPMLKEMQRKTTVELREEKIKYLEKYKKLDQYLKKEMEPPLNKKAKIDEEKKLDFEKEIQEVGKEAGFNWIKRQKNEVIDEVINNHSLSRRDEKEAVFLTQEGIKILLKNFGLLN